VLDAITPSPASDPGALVWYRAASSYLLHEGHLGEARAHLDIARRIFPSDAFFLLDSAYLHQNFSSVSVQAAAQDLRDAGANPAVQSRRMELERAERFFRQTLGLDPGQTDARLRLGHTLGELGRHDEAAIELRRAIEARPNGPQLYFAELFLGHEEQALGRSDAAKQHYENAAELYPKAQSPRLALSQLARQSGDRPGALRALRGVTALPPDEGYRWDPWWGYYNAHQEDSERLLDEMRKLARRAIR
jgi:tetratricopeptide (TPR) repeat protein